MDKSTVKDTLLLALRERGYEQIPPVGLLAESFPDTFAPSAFHDAILRDFDSPRLESHARYGVDWAFRHVDLSRVGADDRYLSSFEMLIAYESHPRSPHDARDETVATLAQLLPRIGLDLTQCVFTYFGGGLVGGRRMLPDSAMRDALIRRGVPLDQVTPIEGTSQVTNVRRVNEPAGPRCEVYVRDGQRFMEIGTIVFEEYRFNSHAELHPSDRTVRGFALGIERLCAAAGGTFAVSDCSELGRAVRAVSKLSSIGGGRTNVIRLVDAVRSLCCILCSCYPIPGRNRRRIARRLRKTCYDSAAALGIELNTALSSLLPHVLSEVRGVQVERARTDQVSRRMLDFLDLPERSALSPSAGLPRRQASPKARA